MHSEIFKYLTIFMVLITIQHITAQNLGDITTNINNIGNAVKTCSNNLPDVNNAIQTSVTNCIVNTLTQL